MRHEIERAIANLGHPLISFSLGRIGGLLLVLSRREIGFGLDHGGIWEEVAMEEISAPESVVTDRSRASVGDLSVLISKTRDEVSTYLRHARARQRRLLNVAIVAGALGTALVAPLAIGGKDLSDLLSAGLGFPIWQLVCALAAVCSLVAAVATQMLKSQNLEERVARAESVRARLGILDMGRITGSLTPAQVSTEYAACLELISFI